MYTPTYTGGDEHLNSEFQRISQVLTELAENILTLAYEEPGKPREGMLRYADGTSWNPGSGQGLYYYKSGSWTFIA